MPCATESRHYSLIPMGDPQSDDDLDLTEMATLDIHRVDAVLGPANGRPFLLMKSLPPGMVEGDPVDELEPEAPADDVTPDEPVELDEPETPAEAALEAELEPTVEVPGDPAWEARDAARGSAVAALLAEARSLLCEAHDSEVAEIATGAESDSSAAWDLDDALSCLDSALAIVGRFAALEAQEAAEGGEMVAKAGARLSAASLAQAIAARDAIAALIGDADPDKQTDEGDEPAEQEDEDMDVAKAEAMIDEKLGALREELPEIVSKAVADAAAAAAAQTEAEPEGAVKEGDEVAKAAGEPGTGEAEPDSAGAAPITADVLKSTLEEVVKGAVQPLEDRLAAIEAQPAPGGPLLGNAGDPDARGILGGAQTPEQVTKALEAIKDPQERAQVATAMGAATLAELYRRG